MKNLIKLYKVIKKYGFAEASDLASMQDRIKEHEKKLKYQYEAYKGALKNLEQKIESNKKMHIVEEKTLFKDVEFKKDVIILGDWSTVTGCIIHKSIMM